MGHYEPGELLPYRYTSLANDGYEGVTHAGLVIVDASSGMVLLTHRTYDETDDEPVRETWEFPGGGLEPDEEPYVGAVREFNEETGLVLPEGEVVDGWRSSTGNYQAFVYLAEGTLDLSGFEPNDEVDEVAWHNKADVEQEESHGRLRPEVRDDTPWDKVWNAVSGDEESDMPEDYEPEYTPGTFDLMEPIPIHGVVAPEGAASGDNRTFAPGAMTKRPLRIPFRDTASDIGGHDGAYPVGSVDRMMRKDGLIHWEGQMMTTAKADDLAEKMEFFGGRYGVSVDGDQGKANEEKYHETGILEFDQIRAAGLTAVDIPAFHEAHVAFGHHPDMPADGTLTASMYDAGEMIGARETFDRGPGWVTNPKETRTIHAYWTKKGEPGYAKVGWGTPGDFRRARVLIGEKIAKNSPEKMKYLNQIIAQWHFDALGYWPGELDKPGNKTSAQAKAERAAKASLSQHLKADLDREDILGTDDTDGTESIWEAVLVSAVNTGVSGNRTRPPVDYFHQHATMKDDPWAAPSAALVVEDPDAQGFQRVWGYAGEWGVCHVGMSGQCVEPPRSGSDDYPDFHLGRTKVTQEGGEGYVYTGVLTCGVGHRDADTILAESPEQAMFDNIKNAWAAVRVGENERGIWFSGVVLPKVDDDLLVKIEASGQVSGEWLAGEMRACLTVNVPGFPNRRASAAYDDDGNVVALAASAFGGVPDAPCNQPDSADDPIGELAVAVWARIEAKAEMDLLRARWARDEFANLQKKWES
jgi:8-oxo-dGTP pyrophosphatase MutT (NUDIX family)